MPKDASAEPTVFDLMETAASEALAEFGADHADADTAEDAEAEQDTQEQGTTPRRPAETHPSARRTKAPSTTPPGPEAGQQEAPSGDAESASDEDESEQDDSTDSESPKVPDGYAAVRPLEGTLATEFVLLDDEGELAVPDLTVQYTANHKVRRDRLDQVVRLAQQGVYNVEREQALRAREERLTTQEGEAEKTLALREQQLEQLLSDPNAYERARERFMASNTPDHQVERLQAKVRKMEEEQSRQKEAAAAQQFLTQDIVPALETIAEHLPEVTVDELSDRLAVGMYAFMVNGVVPPSRHNDIRRYIVEELTDWAQQKAAQRRGKTPTPPTKHQGRPMNDKKTPAPADTPARRQVKREIGRVTRPLAKSAPRNDKLNGQPKDSDSLDDIMAFAVNDALQGHLRDEP